MILPHTWVIGAGGLLGSSVRRTLDPLRFVPKQPFVWPYSPSQNSRISQAVSDFVACVRSEPERGFALYWCAGAGVVGTSAAALAAETANLRFFLDRLSAELGALDVHGNIFLASSAGGIYAGSSDRPMTETTTPHPISEYGRSKLEQEAILEAWAGGRRVSTLVGRLANLYGPGQRLEKSQGLISQISRSMLFGVPVHIYVSLDTIRDYVFADDAGRKVVIGLRRLASENPRGGRHVTKLYASEREVSISYILGIFRQMAKRQLKVISGIRAVSAQQPPLLQFRSRVWTDEPPPADTDLLQGVSRLHHYQLALFQRGRLPPPLSFAGR